MRAMCSLISKMKGMNLGCNKQLQVSFATFAKILHAQKLTGIYLDVLFFIFWKRLERKVKERCFSVSVIARHVSKEKSAIVRVYILMWNLKSITLKHVTGMLT